MISKLIKIFDNDKSLRPYQINSKKEIYEAWRSTQSILFQMPTGTGKTRLFTSIMKDIELTNNQITANSKIRILVLAHRAELISQIADTLQKYHLKFGIIKSGILENSDATIQIASIQSLSRRLSRWKNTPFNFIIIDEAHHALANTYKTICSSFPNAKVLGVTATPYRLNGDSFRILFGKLITSLPVQEFINLGYLSNFQYYSIKPTTEFQYELDNIRHYGINGDYAENELMNICDKKTIRAQLIKSYKQYAEGKKGIVYTINKTHNKHIAQQYENIGINVATIDSDTPTKERVQIVNDFKSGKIQIICNVNIFSEGFDCPDIEFIQLARPTLSLSLYLQQVGRALRMSKNKNYAIILDNVGSYNKFGLPNKIQDWQRYFNGRYNHPFMSITNRYFTNSHRSSQPISEGDSEMILINNTDCQSEITSKISSTYYSVLDIISTKEMFPIGLHSYINEKIGMKDVLHNLATPYTSIDSYLDDLMSYDIDEDDIASNILEHTYKFQVNGKYGICRLKLGLDVALLSSEIQKPAANFKPTAYFDILLEPIYQTICVPNSNDYVIASKDNFWGVINGATFTEIVPFKFKSIDEVNCPAKYIVQKGNRFGVLHMNGKVHIPIKYNEIYPSFTNDSFVCEETGKYILVKKGVNTYRLGKKIQRLVKDIYLYSTKDDSGTIYLANYGGEIIFPLGANRIFLTNNNEICLDYKQRHLLLNPDLTLKTPITDGSYTY